MTVEMMTMMTMNGTTESFCLCGFSLCDIELDLTVVFS